MPRRWWESSESGRGCEAGVGYETTRVFCSNSWALTK